MNFMNANHLMRYDLGPLPVSWFLLAMSTRLGRDKLKFIHLKSCSKKKHY